MADGGTGGQLDRLQKAAKAKVDAAKAAAASAGTTPSGLNALTRIQAFDPPDKNYTSSGLRYPDKNTINENSDYVLFQFKKYIM